MRTNFPPVLSEQTSRMFALMAADAYSVDHLERIKNKALRDFYACHSAAGKAWAIYRGARAANALAAKQGVEWDCYRGEFVPFGKALEEYADA